MKTLIVIRHAKAVSHDAAPTDFERALALRGHQDAAHVSLHVAVSHPAPDMMIVSTARRTTETASYFIDAWKLAEQNVVREPRVYDAPLRNLLTLIAELPDNVATVAIVGHNPSVSDLVFYLTSGASAGLATCTVVVVDMEHASSWDEVAAGTGSLRETSAPALLLD
jgi:phosphohistidine phosphatase